MTVHVREPLLAPSAARALLLEAARLLPVEPVPVAAALGRVPAVEVRAPHDLPREANSALDGYALRAADAGRPLPIPFRAAAGGDPPPLPPGSAAGITTGGVLPEGADAVLPVERAIDDGATVRVASGTVAVGDGVRTAGEDIRAGASALAAGTPLGPVAVAALAALGLAEIDCRRRPRVRVLVTGDELVAPGVPLRRGQIHESNGVLIAATLEALGCAVEPPAGVGDDRAATVAALEQALAGADIVLSSGGVSVGPHDHVKPALAELGVRELFWRVALQPGKPVWAGVAPSGAVVVSLPGNPLSTLVGLHLLVRPLVAALLGVEQRDERARLALDVRRLAERTRALPVRLEQGLVRAVEAEASHQLVRAARADALAVIEPGPGVAPAGLEVPIVRLPGPAL